MSVTPLQATLLRLLAAQRKRSGTSYVAGGVALNTLISATRISRDIDLFHDTEEALSASWSSDRMTMTDAGYDVRVLREAPSFVEAIVSTGSERCVLEWARDSAFRFFPLLEHELLGLVLHPFDLATNKVLAMAGRLEPRDWIDTLNCDERLQPLGFLIWSACGKDPGYNPQSLLSICRRVHYSRAEVESLDFEGDPPDAARLGERWHRALETAGRICAALPPDRAGTCVVSRSLDLYRGDSDALEGALEDGELHFHEGSIGGAWPRPV